MLKQVKAQSSNSNAKHKQIAIHNSAPRMGHTVTTEKVLTKLY